MAYFHCWTRTRIPVPYKYYGKRIQISIRVSGNMFCIIPCSHRVWNPSPEFEFVSESGSGNKPSGWMLIVIICQWKSLIFTALFMLLLQYRYQKGCPFSYYGYSECANYECSTEVMRTQCDGRQSCLVNLEY